MTIEESINLPKPGTMKTETLNDLASVYLDRLEKGECEPADQPMAAIILGKAIRLAEETANTAWNVSMGFAKGMKEVRAG